MFPTKIIARQNPTCIYIHSIIGTHALHEILCEKTVPQALARPRALSGIIHSVHVYIAGDIARGSGVGAE